MNLHASHGLIAVAIALAGAYQLTRHGKDAPTSPVAALASHGLAASLQPPSTQPLQFDPPGAGRPAATPYDSCIDQPSFDVAVIDCTLLLPKPEKDARRRR